MENDKFKEIETLMELDARHDAILNSLEELDKQIETAIRAAQEQAAKDDGLDSDSQSPESQSSI